MQHGLIDILSVVWIKYLIDISVIAAFIYISRKKH